MRRPLRSRSSRTASARTYTPTRKRRGYQRLLDPPGYDVAALASKCGKSQSHLYSRLSLVLAFAVASGNL